MSPMLYRTASWSNLTRIDCNSAWNRLGLLSRSLASGLIRFLDPGRRLKGPRSRAQMVGKWHGITQSTRLAGFVDELQQGIGREALVTLAIVQDTKGPRGQAHPR